MNFTYRLVQAKQPFFFFFFGFVLFSFFVVVVSVFRNAKFLNPSYLYAHNDAKWVKVPLFFIMGFSLCWSYKVSIVVY